MSDGIDLGDVSTTVDTDPDVYSREFLFAEQKDWLKKLVSEHLRLHEFQGTAIDLDQTIASFAVGNGCRSFLEKKQNELKSVQH